MEIGGGGSFNYVVYFPQVLKKVRCPITNCPSVVHITGRLREHFMYRHFFSRIVVVQ